LDSDQSILGDGNLVFCYQDDVSDIEQVLREKKSFTLRCMLDGIKELQGRVAKWNRFASSVSII
jgi:hypothetical protein